MSYYDSDLKAVLARFHSQPDTDTRKDILKNLSDNQLSRVVIQGVKCEFEREGLEDIALVVLGVISRDSRSKLVHDSDGEIEVEVKHEDANEDGEVVIKMEPESDDDNGVTMMGSKHSKVDDRALAQTPGSSMIASVSTNSNPKRGREAQKRPDTTKEQPTRAGGSPPVSRGFMPRDHPHGPSQINYWERTRNRGAARGSMHQFRPHGPGQAAYLERSSIAYAAQARLLFPERPRWRV